MNERRVGAVTSLSWRGEGVGEVEAPHYGKEGLGWLRKNLIAALTRNLLMVTDDSPNTSDWESGGSGLTVQVLRTPSPEGLDSPRQCSLTILVDYFQPYL